MPLIIPKNLLSKDLLDKENIFVKTEDNASKQDIRPLKVAIVNLMPNKEEAELQLIKMLSNTALQIEIDLITTESYEPKNSDKNHLKEFYKTYSDIQNNKYDAMIITGAPLERVDYSKIKYWDELTKIFEFARRNVYSTMFICWAAQAALNYYYRIPHIIPKDKIFGVYNYNKLQENNLLKGFDDEFFVPQSRYMYIPKSSITNNSLKVLSSREDIGVGIVTSEDNRFIFSFGHWEYDKYTLEKEYIRDKEKGLNTPLPINYYKNDSTKEEINVKWRSSGNLFFSNWLNYCVYQETPYYINDIKNKTVSKFGGTSLSDSNQFLKVKNIVKSKDNRDIIVVSAPGKRTPEDTKITDTLIKISDLNKETTELKKSINNLKICLEEKTQQSFELQHIVENRFKNICIELGLESCETIIVKTLSEIKNSNNKDFIISRGEYLNSKLLANYLDYKFIDAKDLIIFNKYNEINYEESTKNIIKCILENDKVVIPGFYGADINGNIKTFKRGGSDFTGSIIASAIESELYENWTDVNGIMTSNPKLNTDSKTIAKLNYTELYTIVESGAEIYQKEAIIPAKEKNITIRVLNTNNPYGPCTEIKD